MNNTTVPDSQMPFIPWMDVRSNNPFEVIGIILFFALAAGIIYFYLKNKTPPSTPHIEDYSQNLSSAKDRCTYLDNQEVDINEIKSTKDLPKGIRVTLQRDGSTKIFDGTVIDSTNDYFSIFIAPSDNTEQDNKPELGEQFVFLAEIKEQRWTFTSTLQEEIEGKIIIYHFSHTYDINLSSKRNAPRLLQDIPALFSVIPKEAVAGPIPVLDIDGIAVGEIPSTISDISAGGCAIHTFSPLTFSAGDLAVVSFIIPGELNENTIFSAINNVKKNSAHNGGGSILNLKFLHIHQDAFDTITLLVDNSLEEEIIY